MGWELIVGISVVYSYGLATVAIKKIGAVEGSRTRKLVWQYFFAAILALVAAGIAGQIEISRAAVIVAAIGIANAFGCYCHWRAYDISMARTAVLTNLDDLLGMALAYAILGELKVLTPALTAGIVISVVSAAVFAKNRNRPGNGSSPQLMGWVLLYSAIWGVAIFSMRFFSISGMSLLTFVAAWYSGSWIGALFTRYVIMGAKEAGPPLKAGQYAKVSLLAVIIWTSLMLAYWVREIVPITVVQPICLAAEMCIPALIAMIFLGEAKNMSRFEKGLIASCIVGVTLIAFGY